MNRQITHSEYKMKESNTNIYRSYNNQMRKNNQNQPKTISSHCPKHTIYTMKNSFPPISRHEQIVTFTMNQNRWNFMICFLFIH